MNTLTNDQIKEILTNNKNFEASQLLGTSKEMVGYWRKKFKIRSPHSQREAARRFTLNHNFFQQIDSEEKAYILGFIAADGNVTRDKYGCVIKICLHPKDEDILHKINACWKSTYSVRIHKSTEKSGFTNTCREQPKLEVRSSQFGEDLAKYGIIPAKTLSIGFPDIPLDLHRHYLRGLLEGDGYVTKEQFGWVGNIHITNDVQGVCILHGFKEPRKYYLHGPSFNTRGGPAHHEIIKWIYQDASIFLDRKKEMFDMYWKDRIYKPKKRAYPVPIKHIPCALESLPSYLRTP